MKLLTIENPLGVVLDTDHFAIDKLRRFVIDLQADIAEVCGPARFERANDPAIIRVVSMSLTVARLRAERNQLMSALENIVNTLEDQVEDGQSALAIANEALRERHSMANMTIDENHRKIESLQRGEV